MTMVVNNRSTQLDYMIDSISTKNEQIKKIPFNDYNLADINFNINQMYNSKLNDFIFFRKQVDSMFVDARRFYGFLFFIHCIYTILLIIPIFYPDKDLRLNLSWLCLAISGFYFVKETSSLIHDFGGHFQDLYNIADFFQIFIQLSYTILVTIYKDTDLPYFGNNPPDLESYNIEDYYKEHGME